MKRVTLKDKTFELFIPYDRIRAGIEELGARITEDYKDVQMPLFIGVLNGAFMFMGELMQRIELCCEISFVKLASYEGIRPGGEVSELIGLSGDLRGRHIIVVEDIVDTGGSIERMMRSLGEHGPASVEVASLFFKPDAYKKNIRLKYNVFSIANDFIVGFGLDYDRMGRNLRDVYKIVEQEDGI